MQKELQFTLSIIGILIIGGVLLHGMWSIRKNSKKQKKARFQSHNWEPGFEQEDGFEDDEGPMYDDVGVGKARVIINPADKSETDVDHFEPISINAVAEENNAVNDDSQLDELSTINVTNKLGDSATKSANDDADSVNYEQDGQNTPTAFTEESITNNIEQTNTMDSGIGGFANEPLQSSDKPVEQSDNEVVIDTLSVVKQSDAPVYSNVVTQPKPEFSKPAISPNEESFGQPPEFLLKQSTPEQLAQQAEVSAQVERERFDSTDTQQQDLNVDNGPDFSLDVQEGPKAINLETEEKSTLGVEKELSFAEQAKRFVRRNKKTVAEKIRKEPVLKDKAAEDQMRIDFDESQNSQNKEALIAKRDELNDQGAKTAASQQPEDSSKPAIGETDVLVLNVRSSDDNPIGGASLLPMLLTLGFKFGEHDIFHRHVNTNGKGPILFSLTNMFKPGVFDIDNIENFSTYGLSLFMMLPIEGDPQQVFNMMHNAARKLSDEFSCRILDGNKVGLSKQSLQQYVERIREFERRRIAK
ncbi:MAG: cell division protein ZipA [Alphaproteobacteria bacterium]|jgi:cell division protein ZipA